MVQAAINAKHLPREGLLTEVDVPLRLARAHCAAEFVSEGTRTAGRYACRTDALHHLLVDECLHVRSAGEHLYTGRGRVDLLGAARPCDEEQDLENLATARHGEDVCHPRADPFEVLRRLDNPYQGQPSGGGGTIGVSSDDFANLRNLMRDTNTCGPEHDCAVGAKIFTTCDMTLACGRQKLIA